MTPDQRAAMRQGPVGISNSDRERLREHVRELPEDKRKELTERWRKMSQEERSATIDNVQRQRRQQQQDQRPTQIRQGLDRQQGRQLPPRQQRTPRQIPDRSQTDSPVRR